MTSAAHALYRRWIEELWSGHLDRAADFISRDFVGHWPDHDVQGLTALLGTVQQARDMFTASTFAIELGPIAEGSLVSGRWRGQATMPDGQSMAFIGNDLLRIEDGQFVEYRVATNPV